MIPSKSDCPRCGKLREMTPKKVCMQCMISLRAKGDLHRRYCKRAPAEVQLSFNEVDDAIGR